MKHSMDTSSMKGVARSSISIVIPTKNRPGELANTVRTVLAQTVLPDEMIIIDQSQDDEARRVLASLYAEAATYICQRVKLIHCVDSTITGLTVARNRGIAAATGDIILFLDDDVLLEVNFIAELLSVYEAHPEAVGVSGVVTNYAPPTLAFRMWYSIFVRGCLHDDRQPVYWDASVLQGRTLVRVTRLGGGLMSFRASKIRRMKFDENLRGVSDGEDVDFCVRLGPDTALFIAPGARLVHNQSPQGREQGHWMRRHARATVYLYRRNWSRGLWNRVCMAWLNVGYSLMALVASGSRLSFEPWRALLAGRREGRSAAKGVAADTLAQGLCPFQYGNRD